MPRVDRVVGVPWGLWLTGPICLYRIPSQKVQKIPRRHGSRSGVGSPTGIARRSLSQRVPLRAATCSGGQVQVQPGHGVPHCTAVRRYRYKGAVLRQARSRYAAECSREGAGTHAKWGAERGPASQSTERHGYSSPDSTEAAGSAGREPAGPPILTVTPSPLMPTATVMLGPEPEPWDLIAPVARSRSRAG